MSKRSRYEKLLSYRNRESAVSFKRPSFHFEFFTASSSEAYYGNQNSRQNSNLPTARTNNNCSSKGGSKNLNKAQNGENCTNVLQQRSVSTK